MEIDENKSERNITIVDIANALGVSKTTVSRAISGKGRIGTDTKERVLRYIEENDYTPNVLARGLAQSKTYNIGITLPGDYNVSELPYFQKVLAGACDYLSAMDYDVIVTKTSEDEIDNLTRIISNRKVDGMIITRSTVSGKAIEFLKSKKIPFLILGSYPDENVFQIDSKHAEGCMELTGILLMKGMKKLALFCGNPNHYVTISRRKGYQEAYNKLKIPINQELIYENLSSYSQIERAVVDALRQKVECIVCMDDNLCYQVLRKLKKDGIRIPEEIKVASFFGSTLLSGSSPAITCVEFDNDEVGTIAARKLLSIIDGQEDKIKKIELGYEISMKESTK